MVLIFGILLLLLAVSAYIDLTTRIIPNRLALILLGLGFASQAWFFGLNGVYLALIGSIAGFVPMLLIHLLTGIGAGDVKLMAAIGAIVGLRSILAIWVYSYLISGIAAMVILAWRFYKTLNSSDRRPVNGQPDHQREMPMAPGITLASAYVLWPQLSQAMHI